MINVPYLSADVVKVNTLPNLPTNPNTVFLVTGDDAPDDLDIYVSTSDGKSFKKIDLPALNNVKLMNVDGTRTIGYLSLLQN